MHYLSPLDQVLRNAYGLWEQLLASTLDLLVDYHGDSNQTPKSTGVFKTGAVHWASGSPDTIQGGREREGEQASKRASQVKLRFTPCKQARQLDMFNRVRLSVYAL